MPEFHATLTPGVLDSTDETLTLAFDEPEQADGVAVYLFEVDRWGRGAERMTEKAGGEDDLIALFRGNIRDTRFEGRLVRQGRARRGAPSLRLQIDGDGSVLVLPVPSGGNEHEAGVLAIALS